MRYGRNIPPLLSKLLRAIKAVAEKVSYFLHHALDPAACCRFGVGGSSYRTTEGVTFNERFVILAQRRAGLP